MLLSFVFVRVLVVLYLPMVLIIEKQREREIEESTYFGFDLYFPLRAIGPLGSPKIAYSMGDSILCFVSKGKQFID